jgi:hypothetical protein
MKTDLPAYEYEGARAIVELHEHSLWSFLETWKAAKAANVDLPKTDDPSYVSLETLLCHVCACARGYMVWMCEVLSLPDPEIKAVPEPESIEKGVEDYLGHVSERWKEPLARVTEKQFYRPEYASRWKVNYCVDAMLEHAVMHPVRHEFQLRKLLEKRSG